MQLTLIWMYYIMISCFKLTIKCTILIRVGYRNPVQIWHCYVRNRYVLEPNQNADFGAMPERSVEIFVLCFFETDESIIIKVQGFFICHIINYTGYNQKWNVKRHRTFHLIKLTSYHTVYTETSRQPVKIEVWFKSVAYYKHINHLIVEKIQLLLKKIKGIFTQSKSLQKTKKQL